MLEAAQKLPSDPVQQRAIIAQMTTRQTELEATLRARDEAIDKHARKIELLLERRELLRYQRFGRKADRISKDQLALFDEAELNVLLEELDAQVAEAKAPPRSERSEPKRTPKRKPLPAHLPRVERMLDLPEEEQALIAATHVRIGFDESEQLGVLPKQYYVIRIKRAKYAPIHADVPGAEAGIRVAPRPARILPKAIAHSSLLAEVVTDKFADGLPLCRQEKIFARKGIDLSRQTLSRGATMGQSHCWPGSGTPFAMAPVPWQSVVGAGSVEPPTGDSHLWAFACQLATEHMFANLLPRSVAPCTTIFDYHPRSISDAH